MPPAAGVIEEGTASAASKLVAALAGGAVERPEATRAVDRTACVEHPNLTASHDRLLHDYSYIDQSVTRKKEAIVNQVAH